MMTTCVGSFVHEKPLCVTVSCSCRSVHSREYSGTSLLRSPTGLGESDLNGEVTVLQGYNVPLFALWNTIWDGARVK